MILRGRNTDIILRNKLSSLVERRVKVENITNRMHIQSYRDTWLTFKDSSRTILIIEVIFDQDTDTTSIADSKLTLINEYLNKDGYEIISTTPNQSSTFSNEYVMTLIVRQPRKVKVTN